MIASIARYEIRLAHWLAASVGAPYKFGGRGPTGIDCSSLLMRAIRKSLRLTVAQLPWMTADQMARGRQGVTVQATEMVSAQRCLLAFSTGTKTESTNMPRRACRTDRGSGRLRRQARSSGSILDRLRFGTVNGVKLRGRWTGGEAPCAWSTGVPWGQSDNGTRIRSPMDLDGSVRGMQSGVPRLLYQACPYIAPALDGSLRARARKIECRRRHDRETPSELAR